MMSMGKLAGKYGGLLCVLSFVVACAQQPLINAVPDWLYNPPEGVVTSCGFNIYGRYQQEECAIQRGRERLAAEKGVSIDSIAVMKERIVNGYESVSMNKETTSTTTDTIIKARVKAFYYDVPRDEYYVWMVPN